MGPAASAGGLKFLRAFEAAKMAARGRENVAVARISPPTAASRADLAMPICP